MKDLTICVATGLADRAAIMVEAATAACSSYSALHCLSFGTQDVNAALARSIFAWAAASHARRLNVSYSFRSTDVGFRAAAAVLMDPACRMQTLVLEYLDDPWIEAGPEDARVPAETDPFETLSLSHPDAEVLLASLRTNTSLRCLHISNQGSGYAEGHRPVPWDLARCLRKSNEALRTSLATNAGLVSVGLIGVGADEATAAAVRAGLQANPRLRRTHVDVREEGVYFSR